MKRSILSALILVTALVCAAPSGAQSRIVVGGRGVPMLADALYLFPGVGPSIVAFASADQGLGIFMSAIDPTFSAKARFDKSAGPEVYASFKPDIIILKEMMRSQLKPGLDALGLRQVYLNLETPEDYYKDLATLGNLFGQETRAREVIAWFQTREQSITRRTSSIPQEQKPRVLVLQHGTGGEGIWQVPPASWIQTLMVERAGGVPVWKQANPGNGWATVGLEQIAAWNPDIVLIIRYGGDSRESARGFAKDPRLAGLAAVRNGKVFGFPQDFYSWDQPDTRWILGFTWLARTIQPALFGDVDLAGFTREFYSFMYGFDAATFDRLIRPKLAGDLGVQF